MADTDGMEIPCGKTVVDATPENPKAVDEVCFLPECFYDNFRSDAAIGNISFRSAVSI